MVEEINKDSEKKTEVSQESNSSGSLLDKFRENPWVISTIVLGLIVVVLLYNSFVGTGSAISNGVISEEEAGDYLLDYYEGMGASGLTVDSVEEVYGLYKVNFDNQLNNLS